MAMALFLVRLSLGAMDGLQASRPHVKGYDKGKAGVVQFLAAREGLSTSEMLGKLFDEALAARVPGLDSLLT